MASSIPVEDPENPQDVATNNSNNSITAPFWVSSALRLFLATQEASQEWQNTTCPPGALQCCQTFSATHNFFFLRPWAIACKDGVHWIEHRFFNGCWCCRSQLLNKEMVKPSGMVALEFCQRTMPHSPKNTWPLGIFSQAFRPSRFSLGFKRISRVTGIKPNLRKVGIVLTHGELWNQHLGLNELTSCHSEQELICSAKGLWPKPKVFIMFCTLRAQQKSRSSGTRLAAVFFQLPAGGVASSLPGHTWDGHDPVEHSFLLTSPSWPTKFYCSLKYPHPKESRVMFKTKN